MTYQCVAASAAGFVQQLAVAYIAHGYYFYVAGRVPDEKDPAATDEKIVAQYGIELSKWARARRKREGQARLQYLRYSRFFVILATHGEHPFFEAEARRLRDIRVHPLHVLGYSIGCRQGRGGGAFHASVRINRVLWRELKARFEELAVHRSVDDLASALRSLPYEPYAPVRDQIRGVLRAVNRRRRTAGMELVPGEALWLRRVPVRPFG